VDAPNYFAGEALRIPSSRHIRPEQQLPALFNEKNLLDTDKVLQIFFDSCFIAGPSGCSFYASSPEAISKNLDKLYDMTKTTPFPVLNNTSSYGVVDYNFLRTTIFISLYSPYSSFPPLADALAELSKGNARPLWDYGSAMQVNEVSDPLIAIGCNDASLIPGTLEDAEQFYNKLVKTSEWADVWIRERISCSYVICTGFYDKPDFTKSSVDGPIYRKTFSEARHMFDSSIIYYIFLYLGPFVGNTSYPLLFIGNTAGT
jgi:hypothetical protein